MAPTIPEIMQKIPAAFSGSTDQDIDAVVHLKFTGAEAGEWNVTIRAGECLIAQGLPRTRPTLTVSADSADFVRIVTGELDGMQSYMDGRLKIVGDTGLVPRLLRIFKLG